MAWPELPVDIMYTILLNLPVKSLQRFKTVCKSWNAIISDRQFAKIHHQKSKNSKTQNLFLFKPLWPQELCLFKYENGDLLFQPKLQQPDGSKYVLCSGDGLALSSVVTGEGKKDFVLWNPSSRKRERLRRPFFVDDHRANFGFCHDSNLDDYKVVIRFKVYYAVYSCKKKSWSKKQKNQHEILSPNAGLLVDGFSFWVLNDDHYKPKGITFFDPRDDKFKILQKPKHLEGVETFYLTSIKGYLCSYHNVREETFTGLRVWIMKGHVDSCSWSELLNVNIFEAVDPLHIVWPMFFTEKNEILVDLNSYEHSICYNLPGKAFQTVHYGHGISSCFPVVPYQDSLFFPIQDSTRPKRKRK